MLAVLALGNLKLSAKLQEILNFSISVALIQ